MANYKLLTHESTGATSELMFTAGGTNTVVSSITAKDGSGQTAEVLVKKSGSSTVIEMAEVDLTSNAGFQIIDVAFALEASDELYIRATRGGMKFIMSYVEETELPNDTALGGLVDVSTSGATDGQSLVYSSTSSQWEPSTITGGGGGGASELDDLSDVAITGSSSGDFLKHNGSNYVDVNFDSAVNANATVIANGAKVGYTTALFDADFATKDADDIDDSSTTHRFVTATQQTTLGNLAAVTTALNLEDMADDIADNNAKVSYTDSAAVAANTLKNSYPSADATKLAGIAAGATANDTDANLKDRGNHTGTQTSSTISDFQVEVESIIGDQIDNTDAVPEGTTNLYHTDARVDARIGAADIADLNNVSATAPSSGQVLKWNGTAWAPAADNSSTGGAGGVVDSVNGISQAAVVLDADDIDDSSTAHKFVTATDVTKLGNITAPSAVNLDTINALAGFAFTAANTAAADITAHEGSLRNHSDIAYTQSNPANIPNGSFLRWDSTGTSWGDTMVDLQDLNNVDTPTTGEFLKWNGSTWETDTAGSGNPLATHDQTLDADRTIDTDGQTLEIAVNSGEFLATDGAVTYLQMGVGELYLQGNKMPSGNGTNGQVLTTNGTGTMTWSGVSSENIANTNLQADNNRTLALDANTFTVDLDDGGEFFVLDSATSTTSIEVGSGDLRLNDQTFPSTDGTSGQVLQTNGAGVMSWTTPSGGGGGGNPLSSHDQTLTGDRTIDTDGNDLTVELDSTTSDVFTINDGSNTLFEVDTNTSGELFAVNDISGLTTFSSNDTGSMVLPKILKSAPTAAATEGTMQLGIVSGTCYLYVYINGGWKSTTLT